jgi:7-cyano-7-deazaguanine synthase
MTTTPYTIAVVSGGMDSVTLAYHLADQGHRLHILSVNYGQRHKKELHYAAQAAAALDAPHTIADLSAITPLLAGSALTSPDAVDVPEGHYAADTMRATVVANRNAILLNVAAGLAVSQGADHIATGVHAGDHFIYPDCRPDFIDALNTSLVLGNAGFAKPGFSILAPFVNLTKADIAALGDRAGVPWADTWSCYKGAEIHCGACGTCVERREAFALAGIEDPTVYAATPQWEVVS